MPIPEELGIGQPPPFEQRIEELFNLSPAQHEQFSRAILARLSAEDAAKPVDQLAPRTIVFEVPK